MTIVGEGLWKLHGVLLTRRLRRAEQLLCNEVPYAWRALSMSRSLGGLNHVHQAMRLLELSRLVARYRPGSVLELGAGTTTAVFAQHIEPGPDGYPRVVSMEEETHWLEMTRRIVPVELHSRVQFCLRPRVVEMWDGQYVARYDTGYDSYYDLVYVDGPSDRLALNDGKPRTVPVVDVMCLIRAGFPPRTIFVDGKRQSIAFFRSLGIEQQYHMALRSEFRPGRQPLLVPYRHHTIFERK